MQFANAEIVNGTTYLVFDPGELGLLLGSDGRVELVPNCSSAAVTLRAIRSGTLRVASGASVSLRIALDHSEAAVIEIRDGSETGSEGAGRRRPALRIAGE